MLKTTILFCFSFLIFGCKHPESEKYKRNQKSSYDSPNSEPETQIFEADEKNVLKMEVENGVRYVWIEINGMKLRFIFDTGASSICISSAEAIVLYRQGLLKDEDFIGSEYFQDATGKISEGTKINLREVKIGNIILENIEATIINNVNAPLLLGQTAFQQFGKIEIDNQNNEIIFK